MATIYLVPLNDIYVDVGPLRTVSTAGLKAAITTGTVDFFLSASKSSSATAADPTLSGTATYVGSASDGDGNTYDAGMWICQLDAAVLTASLLRTHFQATSKAYLYVKRDNNIRRMVELTYVDTLPVTIVES
jgi:hypothetical protein